MTDIPAGVVVHEVLGADLPVEPPVGTVVIDANGRFYQRCEWFHYIDALPFGSSVQWTGVGERRRCARPSWMELLDRGPVTIVWRPEPTKDGEEA